MRNIALAAIQLYQRHLSPLKGYSCAYRIHTGKQSCSAFGYRVIDRYGCRLGYLLLRRRLQDCAVACCRPARAEPATPAPRAPRGHASQAGFCDLADVSCDLPSCDLSLPCELGETALDLADLCGSCSLGSAERKAKREQRRRRQQGFHGDSGPR